MTTTDTQPQDSPESPNRIWIEIYREGYPVPTEFYTHEIPHSIEYVRAAVAGPRGDESGWLLEKMYEGNVHYICADNILQWTDDPNKALRLARREDAEALATIVEDCEKIAEHEWVPPAATSSPTPAESVCAKCGGSGEIEIGCAMDHALTAPCVECRGTGTVTATPPESTRVAGEQCGYCASPEHFAVAVVLPNVAGRWHRSSGGGHYRCTALSTSDSARRAAVEIEIEFPQLPNYSTDKVAAIISKHFAAAAPADNDAEGR